MFSTATSLAVIAEAAPANEPSVFHSLRGKRVQPGDCTECIGAGVGAASLPNQISQRHSSFCRVAYNAYFCVLFIVALVSLVCSQLEPTDTATLVLNIIVIYGFLGFLSRKRYNIDSIAVKRVSSSFRFVCICALLLSYAAFDVYLSYLRQRSPQAAAATIFMMVLFILCLLFDFSPNLPTTVQTAISVCACFASF